MLTEIQKQFIEELKTTTIPKIKNRLVKIEGNEVIGCCAQGLCMLKFEGVKPELLKTSAIIAPIHFNKKIRAGKQVYKSLVNMNDHSELTFKQMAIALEKNPESWGITAPVILVQYPKGK